MSIDKDRQDFTREGIEMYDSLLRAITKAGGCIDANILDMTVLELITRLAVNGVRFTNKPICVDNDDYAVVPIGMLIRSKISANGRRIVGNGKCPNCGRYHSHTEIDIPEWKYLCRECGVLFGKKDK